MLIVQKVLDLVKSILKVFMFLWFVHYLENSMLGILTGDLNNYTNRIKKVQFFLENLCLKEYLCLI